MLIKYYCMVATFLWLHGGGHSSHLMAKQRQHLVYLVHAQGLLALFQFAHEAQPHARLFCQINLG